VEAEACQACAALRRTAAYEHTPIIMLTGAGTPRVHVAAERAGTTALLVKPLSVRDLMREIDRLGIEGFRLPRRELPTTEAGRSGNLGEVPMKVWNPSPGLSWNFGEKSKLADGRRFLETLRRSTATRR
jgi:CheY-like chemotaxis protein